MEKEMTGADRRKEILSSGSPCRTQPDAPADHSGSNRRGYRKASDTGIF